MPLRYRIRRLGAYRLLLAVAAFLFSWHIFRIGDINFTLSDAALFGCLMLLASRRGLNAQPLGALTPPLLLGLVLLLGGMLAGSAANGNPLRWMVIAGQYVFAYMLVPMILFSADRAWLRRCALFFALGVATAQVIAIAASFFICVRPPKRPVRRPCCDRLAKHAGTIQGSPRVIRDPIGA